MKLTNLKPRLKAANTAKVETLASPGSWRAGKSGSTARGYGYRWQKARERFIRDHPLCAYCSREGITTAASVVDHIEPHQGDETKFWDETNWQPLCKPCHDGEKKREEGRGVKSLQPFER